MQVTDLNLSAVALAAACAALTMAGEPMTIAVERGSASFVVDTSVPAVSVKEKSTEMQARVRAERGAAALHIEQIEAWLPVNSLATGMGLRDQHMRRYIFTASDGKTPDLRFDGQDALCPVSASKAKCEELPHTGQS